MSLYRWTRDRRCRGHYMTLWEKEVCPFIKCACFAYANRIITLALPRGGGPHRCIEHSDLTTRQRRRPWREEGAFGRNGRRGRPSICISRTYDVHNNSLRSGSDRSLSPRGTCATPLMILMIREGFGRSEQWALLKKWPPLMDWFCRMGHKKAPPLHASTLLHNRKWISWICGDPSDGPWICVH